MERYFGDIFQRDILERYFREAQERCKELKPHEIVQRTRSEIQKKHRYISERYFGEAQERFKELKSQEIMK